MNADRSKNEDRYDASWRNVVKAASGIADALSQDRLHDHARQLDALNRLAGFVAGDTLQKLGLFKDERVAEATDGANAHQRLAVEQRRAFQRLVTIAVETGLLVRIAYDRYERVRPWPPAPSTTEIAAMRALFSENADLLDFVQGFGRALPDILTGRMHAAEMLFRDGLIEVATRLYSQAPPFRYCNEVAVAAMKARIAQEAVAADLHVVEVGAGTGATTKALLHDVTEGIGRYLFTDISTFFLTDARRAFANVSFMDYQLLDLEAAPRDELRGAFDICIAAHVLHATRQIDETLHNVRSLLKAGGILILLEETSMQPFFSVTMGTQTGLDRFDDMPLRTEHPLLTAERWEERAKVAGFQRFAAFPEIMGIRPMLMQV